ncbi:hypothetical protein GCM10010240_60010 [Streptomyces griseoviridis]|nr:hypothetical protein GCM10010240_60010 [Streptomyces griseoviridis]
MPASDEWRLRRDGTAVLCRERDCGGGAVGTGPTCGNGTDPSGRDRLAGTVAACSAGFRRSGA